MRRVSFGSLMSECCDELTVRDLRDNIASGSRVALRRGVAVEVLGAVGDGESTGREGEDHGGGTHFDGWC